MFYSSFFSSSLQMPCRRSSYRVECEKKQLICDWGHFFSFFLLFLPPHPHPSYRFRYEFMKTSRSPAISNRPRIARTISKQRQNVQQTNKYIYEKKNRFSLSLRTKHFYFASSFSQWLSASARDRDIEIGSVRLFDKSQAHDSEHQRTRYTAITYCFFIQWHNC